MKGTTILQLLAFSACGVLCNGASDCWSMKGWYPGVQPKPITDKTPYKLFVTSTVPHYKEGLYNVETVHNVTLMRNDTAGDNGTFVGFIIYAKVQYPEDRPSYGHFLKPLPAGIEIMECTDGYKFEVARNSTSEKRTFVHLQWKAPPKGAVGRITFSASVAEAAGVYYEGLEYGLTYNCPVPGCYIPGGCPNGLARNKYGCITCECAGCSNIGLAFSSLLGVLALLVHHIL